MGGDAGNAEAGALLEGDVFRQRRDVRDGNDGELGGGAEWAVGLGAEAPCSFSDPVGRNAVADEVDGSSAVAVRDDTREGHAIAEGVLTLFGVAGIDSGGGDSEADLTGARYGIGHFADCENLLRGSLLFVPRCFHCVSPIR